jgi:hypothetical protein
MVGDGRNQILDIHPNWEMILLLARSSHSVTSQMQRTLDGAIEWKNMFTPTPKQKPEHIREIEQMVENSLKIEEQAKGAVYSLRG